MCDTFSMRAFVSASQVLLQDAVESPVVLVEFPQSHGAFWSFLQLCGGVAEKITLAPHKDSNVPRRLHPHLPRVHGVLFHTLFESESQEVKLDMRTRAVLSSDAPGWD